MSCYSKPNTTAKRCWCSWRLTFRQFFLDAIQECQPLTTKLPLSTVFVFNVYIHAHIYYFGQGVKFSGCVGIRYSLQPLWRVLYYELWCLALRKFIECPKQFAASIFACHLFHAGYLIGLLFHPKDGSRMFPETSVPFYRTTQRYILEDSTIFRVLFTKTPGSFLVMPAVTPADIHVSGVFCTCHHRHWSYAWHSLPKCRRWGTVWKQFITMRPTMGLITVPCWRADNGQRICMSRHILTSEQDVYTSRLSSVDCSWGELGSGGSLWNGENYSVQKRIWSASVWII
jgi:hypothetical protein